MASAALPIRMLAEPVRTKTAAGVIAGYTAIGTEFEHPARMIFLQNLTDATVMFSLDGVNDHFPLPANGFIILDVCSNTSVTQGFYIAQHTTLYVKEVGVPATGSIYLTVFYGKE